MPAGGLFCIVITVEKKGGGELKVPFPCIYLCRVCMYSDRFARQLVCARPARPIYMLDRPSSISARPVLLA